MWSTIDEQVFGNIDWDLSWDQIGSTISELDWKKIKAALEKKEEEPKSNDIVAP